MTVNDGAVRRVAGALTAAAALSVLTTAVVHRSDAQPAPDPRSAMITTLAASGPHPSLGDEARVFDWLVGAWDSEFTFHNDDGTTRHASGEILFGWILDGRVLQDIWISYPKDAGKERSIGTSLRYFDPEKKVWRVFFVNPVYGSITVQGGAEGDGIVLRGVDDEGAALRWSFTDIEADSFAWRGEKSRDGGTTWRLEEEHRMRRRTSPGPGGAAAAFERLSSLVGQWEGVQDGTDVTLTYTLTADGSALMEEFRPAEGPVMITMFSVDGDHLVATHYCSAGNQPQMVTDAIREPWDGALVFSLLRVTGMKTPDDWHNTGLEVRLDGEDRLTQQWTYLYQGKAGSNVFHFTRKPG